MKRFINIRNAVRLLCAMTLAILLISPKTAHAGSATINQGETKPYTATSAGENITVTLNNAYTSVQLRGKPSWITYKKDGSKFILTLSKNASGEKRTGDVAFVDGSKVWTLRVTQNPVVVYVSFNVNGGSGNISSKTYTVSKTYGSIPAGPTPPKGHSFDGWYTAKSGGSKITASSTVSESVTTLYAHYSAKKYNVSFNSNGGSSCSSQKVTYNSTYGTLPTPGRTGYKFVGWYTASSGGTKITSSSKHTSASDITLYAHWEASPIVVTFYSNNGTDDATSRTYYYGQKFGSLPASPALPSAGYKFVGWFTAKSGGTQITADTTVTTSYTSLYAQFKAKELIVSFDSCNGSAASSKNVIFDSAYGSLPTTERNGYKFVGWYTAKSGGTKITASTIVSITNDHTLYAHWKANTYKVTFDSDNGSAVSAITVTFGGKYGDLETPTKDGYTFKGWYTSKTGGSQVTPQTVVKIAADHTLYARWQGDPITVKFSNNGGYGTVPDQTYIIGDPYGHLPAGTTASDGGYKFGGWYTAKVGGVRIFKDTIVSKMYKTLYAHYIARTFTVTFDSCGGSETTTKKVTYDSAYGTLQQTTREGYAFRGWYTEPDGGTRVTAQSIVTTAADHTLYARWEARHFRVTFDTNDGSDVATKIVTYDSAYGKLEMPKRLGYTFTGWYTDPDKGTRVTAATIVKTAADHTLYARWRANTYTVTFDSRGGTPIDPIQVSYGGTYGALPTPKNDHYTFVGWFTSSGLQVLPSTVVTTTNDHTLVAHWRRLEAYITFDVNGGTGVIPSRWLKPDSRLDILIAPKRTNYTFIGWYTEKTGGEQVYSTTRIHDIKNHTFYAHWVRNSDFVFKDLLPVEIDEKTPLASAMSHNLRITSDLSQTEKYSEFVVDFYTNSRPIGTYWCLIQCNMSTSDLVRQGFKPSGGRLYAGLQYTPEGAKSDLAMWRVRINNGNTSIYAETKTVYPGDDMQHYNNEELGMKYQRKFEWNANTWYRMYLRCYEGDNGNTYVAQWVQAIGDKDWHLIVIIDTNLKDSYFTGQIQQFMEDYKVDGDKGTRTIALRNMWVRKKSGDWVFVDSITLESNSASRGVAGLGRNNTTVYGITTEYGADTQNLYDEIKLKCNGLQKTTTRPITPYSN
jgi:Listeria/Bacterioides repeat